MDENIFSFEITNGYFFRQIFEVYDKLVVQGIPIYLKEEGIQILIGTNKIKNKNLTRSIISDIEIYTEDIIDYNLNIKDASSPRKIDRPAFHIEQLNIKDIKDHFKSIKKSNSVKLYKKKDSRRVCIEIKDNDIQKSWINSNSHQKVNYDLSQFKDINEETPNIKIEINKFCDFLKSILKGDPNYISFKIYKNSLSIQSIGNNNDILKEKIWGKPNFVSYFETKVEVSIIKALSKINSMVNNSILKIYSNKEGYLKLHHKIGDFGEHNIYLIEKITS